MAIVGYAKSFSDYFQLSYNDIVIEDGQTITMNNYYDPIVRDYPEYMNILGYEPSFQSEVSIKAYNVSDEDINIAFKLTPLSLMSGCLQICYGIGDYSSYCLGANKDGIVESPMDLQEIKPDSYATMIIQNVRIEQLGPTYCKLDVIVKSNGEEIESAQSSVIIHFVNDNDVTFESSNVSEVDGMIFKVNEDGSTCSLINYRGKSKDVRIPKEVVINGNYYNVTQIKSNSFGYNSLNSLILPNSIERIESNAISSSSNSLRVLIFEDGDSNLLMENGCVSYPNTLEHLSIGRNIIIDNWDYGLIRNIKSLRIGKNVDDIAWFEPQNAPRLIQLSSEAITPPLIGNFSQTQYANISVYISTESKLNYENNPDWAFFNNVYALDSSMNDYEIVLSQSEISLNVGQRIVPDFKIVPNINSEVIFWSVDSDVVNIDNYTKSILAEKPGQTEVYFLLCLNNKIIACEINSVQPAENIILNKKELTLQKGETANVLVNVGPVDVSDPTVTWSSSNPNVATVDNGLITALGGGECDIVATTHNGLTATCHVSVPVAPEQISFESAEVSAIIGDKVTLNAILAPDDVTEKALTWTTSDAEVATVENGVVSCIGLGEAVITATTVNGLSAECKITVNPIMAESITLDRTEVEAQIGETFTLTATISPDDTTDKSVTWTSSDTNVASVESGVVTCVGVGEAVITATTVNGLTATCAVTVTRILVESIVIDPSSIEGERGEQIQLTATVLPENATNKTLDWGSDDEFVAKVSETGLVTIMSERVTRIYARATDGSGVEATCEVTGVAGVDELFVDGKLWNVITPDGILIRKNATKEDIEQLAPALYILTDGKRTVKLVKN